VTVSERQLQDAVLSLCTWLRLLAYHTHDSRRSQPGYPDLTVVGRKGVLFRELKSATGRPTRAQKEWLESLAAAGQDAAVWRPEDLASGRVKTELEGII
jgi:hypothetical protein